MLFKDRQEAGKELSKALLHYKNAEKTVVLGLPRGGVILASEIAKALNLPLDVIIPRKIGAPHNEELAIGALAGDTVVLDKEIINSLGGVPSSYIDQTVAKEKQEAARRLALYRKGKGAQNFRGWTVIIVDDGIATGSTLRASLAYLRQAGSAKIVVAVPLAPPETAKEFRHAVDEWICLYTPASFYAVGQFYAVFEQVSDEEVIRKLR